MPFVWCVILLFLGLFTNYMFTLHSSDKTFAGVAIVTCQLTFQGSVLAVAISPDGLYLVSAGEDRNIRVWDLSAGTMLKELHGHTDTVYSLAFSADGTLLVSGGLDNSVHVWDFMKVLNSSNSSISNTGVSSEHMASFATNNASVYSVQFNTCNLVLAAGTVTP